MKWFPLLLLLPGVFGLGGFGNSYLKDTELCRPWTNLNNKLYAGVELPPLTDVTNSLKSLLPEGEWQAVVEAVVGACYAADKPRTYTDTCPGQALLHCLVDNLISKCPESALRKEDSCAPLSSLAGFNYMFSQSRYNDMAKYLPTERRPLWFLQNYFSSKCCDVPQLFSPRVLSESGFSSLIHYYDHDPKPKGPHFAQNTPAMIVTTEAHIAERVRVVERPEIEIHDPLDCCDMSEFIAPESRSSCKFQTTWNDRKRLEIVDNKLDEVTTTTVKPETSQKHHDVKVVPLSCDQETCVFKLLNIVSDSGLVDTAAFSRLLDNLTSEHPEWLKAKARVVTRCLTKPVRDYEGDCEINKVLACTFDVLSENCPHAKKATVDPCRHTYSMKNDTICQINSSKFRPKNRRQYCDFPRFVNHEVLSSCGISSVSRVEKAPPPAITRPTRKLGWLLFKPLCNETKPTTNCLLTQMNVLNKYKFLDYFKMKDRIRQFTNDNAEWAALSEVYIATLSSMPMYRESCASQRKLLNVMDAMLMTCPVSRRKTTDKCNKMFSEMIQRAPESKPTKTHASYEHDFMTSPKHVERPKFGPPMPQIQRNPIKKHDSVFEKVPIDADELPPVRIIHIKPQRMVIKSQTPEPVHVKTPLVVTPVYMGMTYPTSTPSIVSTSDYRLPSEYLRTGVLYNTPFKHDGAFRSASVPKKVENAHQGNMFGFPNMP